MYRPRMQRSTVAMVLCIVGPLLTAPLSGCNVDFGADCRTVAGIYCLDQWEDGQTYYLFDQREYSLRGQLSGNNVNDGGGVIDGVVRRIAWTSRVILVDRQAVAGSDPNGWMIIDVGRKKVRGPITDAEASSLIARYGLRPQLPASAWERLK